MSTEILIVGGGVIGLMCARELAKAGMQVTVLERRAIGQESSWSGGGILSPLYPWRAPDAVTVLSRWSQEAYPSLIGEIIADTGIDPEWTRSGLLVGDCDDVDEAERWCGANGIVLDALDESMLRCLEPRMEHVPFTHPLLFPAIAQVRNPRLLKALCSDLGRRGVRLVEEQEVIDFESVHGRLNAVKTRERRYVADKFIIASGAWSPLVGGELTRSLKIEPVKGQMLVFSPLPQLIQHIVLYQGRYLIPRQDGRILVGSTVERTGFDKATSEDARTSLVEFAISLFPALRAHPVEKHWAGLRPGSPTGVPVISAHPEVANLYLNAGHYRNGFGLAPASARLMSDIVLGRDPCIPVEPYRADRFE